MVYPESNSELYIFQAYLASLFCCANVSQQRRSCRPRTGISAVQTQLIIILENLILSPNNPNILRGQIFEDSMMVASKVT